MEHAARMEEMRNKYETLFTNSEYRLRWEDNIKIDLKEIECRDVDWIHVAQDRIEKRAYVNIVLNLLAT
jgi:hypothetical protein